MKSHTSVMDKTHRLPQRIKAIQPIYELQLQQVHQLWNNRAGRLWGEDYIDWNLRSQLWDETLAVASEVLDETA